MLGCFESTSDADWWIRDVASRGLTEDVLTAPTCRWLFPNGAARATTAKYRVGELQRIMDASARNASNVVSYKEWLRKDAEGAAEGQSRGSCRVSFGSLSAYDGVVAQAHRCGERASACFSVVGGSRVRRWATLVFLVAQRTFRARKPVALRCNTPSDDERHASSTGNNQELGIFIP